MLIMNWRVEYTEYHNDCSKALKINESKQAKEMRRKNNKIQILSIAGIKYRWSFSVDDIAPCSKSIFSRLPQFKSKNQPFKHFIEAFHIKLSQLMCTSSWIVFRDTFTYGARQRRWGSGRDFQQCQNANGTFVISISKYMRQNSNIFFLQNSICKCYRPHAS